MPPQRLQLEITESAAACTTLETLAILHKLHELGVPIAIDDFGTGYSSLSYLRIFPFDKIKIDRSFIPESSNGEPLAMVHAVAGLGNFSTRCRLPKASRPGTWRRCGRCGCTEMQGYSLPAEAPPGE